MLQPGVKSKHPILIVNCTVHQTSPFTYIILSVHLTAILIQGVQPQSEGELP